MARPDRWITGLLVLVILLTDWRLLRAGFTNYDDPFTVVANASVRHPTFSGLARVWTRPAMDLYMPITQTAWMAVGEVSARLDKGMADGGPRAVLFHATNLLVHAGATLLVCSILRVLVPGSRLAAAAGAGLFALHPVQVEAVAWVSGLKDLLSGLFCLAALRLWIAPVRARDQPRVRFTASTGLLLLGMLSKPSAAALPLSAAAVGCIALRWPAPVVLRRLLPWIAVAVPIAFVAHAVQPASQIAPLRVAHRFVLAEDALAFYAGKIVWPTPLTIDYDRTPAAVLTRPGWVVSGETLTVGVCLLAAVFLHRMSPRAVTAVAVFVTTLLPVSGLLPFDFQQFSTVADHYLYAAMVGPALLLACAVEGVQTRVTTGAAGALAGALLGGLGWVSFQQTQVWTSAVTLMQHAVDVKPLAWMPQYNLGLALTPASPAAAIPHLQVAAALRPDLGNIRDGLGAAYARLNRWDAAATAYAAAVRSMPTDAAEQRRLAQALDQSGHPAAAIAAYESALRFEPDRADAISNLASLRAQTGDLSAAIRAYRHALEIDPQFPPARHGLQIALAQQAASSASSSPPGSTRP